MGPSSFAVSQASLQRQVRMEEKFCRWWSEPANIHPLLALGGMSEKSTHWNCKGWRETSKSSCRARTVTVKFYPSFLGKLTKTQPLTALKPEGRYGVFLLHCHHLRHSMEGQGALGIPPMDSLDRVPSRRNSWYFKQTECFILREDLHFS